MENYKILLKNNIDEKNRIKDEIKELEEDIFKYQNRGDHSSFTHCLEKKGYLKEDLSKIEDEIARLERIIDNDGVDPYAPVPISGNSPSKPTNLPIDDGTITSSMTVDININGTTGKGDNKQTINDSYSQTVKRTSDIKDNQIVNQQTSVDTSSSKQSIRTSSSNLIGGSPGARTNKGKHRTLQQSPKKNTNFITINEIREKQKMELFIKNFKNGKTWNESAKFSNVTPSKASKWYNQGKKGFSKNTQFFYGQIKYIETHRFDEDNEISSFNKFKSISKKAERDERKKMDVFIDYLKQGNSWEESVELSKIPSSQAAIWYRRGSYNFTKNTSYFYNQLKKLNIAPSIVNTNVSKESTENTLNPEIVDVEVIDVEVDDEEEIIIDVGVVSEENTVDEEESTASNENLTADRRGKMNLIIFNLKEGKSLEKASEKASVSLDVVNDWIIKGKNGDLEYIDFYNEYKSLRSNISEEYLKSSKNKINIDYSLGNRIQQMDSIHDELTNIKSMMNDIDERISPEEFKSRLENLISIFKLKKEEKIREIEINSKIINSHGYDDCNTIEDFENKKIQIKVELNGIDEEIREAGLRNKHALVHTLQNKKARFKIQLLEIDDIIMLISKQKTLNQDIIEINDKIKELKLQLDNIKDERKQMNKFLDAYRVSESCEDAAKSVNIKIQRIVNWIHEGGNRTNFNKIYFYNEFNKIKDGNERIRRVEELRKFKIKRISQILAQLRKGKTLNQACSIINVSINDVNRWYNDGKNGDGTLNVNFYNQVNEIKSMSEFLDNFKTTLSIQKAIKATNITQKRFDQWYEDGKEGVSENTLWFKKQIDDVELSRNQKIQMNNVLSEMKKGESRFYAASKFNIQFSKVKEWYDLGEKGFDEKTVYFFNEVNKLEPRDNELENMDKILNELRKNTPLIEAANILGIPVNLVKVWLDNGKHLLNDNTVYFYKEYQNIKNDKSSQSSTHSNSNRNPVKNKSKINSFEKKQRKKMQNVLSAMKKGSSRFQAAEKYNIPPSTVKKWYNQGKEMHSDNTVYFFNEVNKLEPRDNELENMDKILNELRKNTPLIEAANILGIPVNLVKVWLDNGKHRLNDNTIYFYKEYQNIKKDNESQSSINSNLNPVKNKPKINYYGPKNSFEKKQRENMQKVLSEMKKGSSRFQAAEKYNIPSSTVKKWYNQGKEMHSDNTVYFYRNVNLIEPRANEIEKMNLILYAVKNGKSLKEAAESVNVSVRLANAWFDNGKNGLNKPTIYFYNQIQKENQNEFYKMGRVLDALNNGMSKDEACKIAGASQSKLDTWIKQGKAGENKNAEYFIKEFNKLNIDVNDKTSNNKSCPKCGKLVDTSQNYCNFCGYQLKQVKKKESFFDKIKGIF